MKILFTKEEMARRSEVLKIVKLSHSDAEKIADVVGTVNREYLGITDGEDNEGNTVIEIETELVLDFLEFYEKAISLVLPVIISFKTAFKAIGIFEDRFNAKWKINSKKKE